ncbi:hypothetical protein SRHO_G00334640 [Serrasalmus rhombeus]
MHKQLSIHAHTARLALEWKALEVFVDLRLEQHDDLVALTTAFQRHFDQQCGRLDSYSLRSGGGQACLAFEKAMQKELVQEHFRSVPPEELRQHVQLTALTSLQAAVAEAEWAELILKQYDTTWQELSEEMTS